MPTTERMLPTMMEAPNVEPWFNVYRPTDLDALGEPLPVIAWANGGCVRDESTWKTPLIERWAAAGYFVVAITSSAQASLFDMTTSDTHKALIDWVMEQATKDGGPYAGKLDTKRIVTSGNSCGGVTALEVAAKDERVAAVFVLSGSSALGASDQGIIGGIKVPVGYVTGNPSEDVAGPNAAMDYDLLKVPAMLVSRSMGDHPTVSTDTQILGDLALISLNFLELAMYGTRAAADTLNSPTVCTGCTMGMWKMQSKDLDKLVH